MYFIPDSYANLVKYFDNFAQNAFDSNFALCGPPSPKVAVSPLDEKLLLSCADNAAAVLSYSCLCYEFQGYSVYRGKSAVGPWPLIKT